MDRARSKSEAFIFKLITLKWIKIKDLNEIEKCINETLFNIFTNAQFLNSNYQKLPSKVSSLSQVLNAH